MQRLAIPGSAPDHAGDRRESEADSEAPLLATIVLRSPDSGVAEALLSGHFDPSTHRPANSDPTTIAAVEAFAKSNGLKIERSDPAGHRVVVSGPLSRMSQAFGVRFGQFASPAGTLYRSYDGPITVPADIAPSILAVLGLDTRTVATDRGA